jgi:hypothetical protein
MTDYNDWSENALVYEYRRKRHNDGISTSSLLAHLLQLDDELKAAEARIEELEGQLNSMEYGGVKSVTGTDNAT